MNKKNHSISSQDLRQPKDTMALMVAPSRDPYANSDPFHQQNQIQQFPQAYQAQSAHATTSYGYQQTDMSADNGSQGSASPSDYSTFDSTVNDGQANMTNTKNPVKAGRGIPNQSIHEAPQSKNRRRTSPHQLEVLNAHFLESTKPDIIARQRLSAELGMTVREVQVWFQNRRAKQKKIDAKEAGIEPQSKWPSYNTQLPQQLPATASSNSYEAAYYAQQRQLLPDGRPNPRYGSPNTYTQSGEGPYPQALINALQHRVVPRPAPQTLQPVHHGIYNSSQLYPTPTGTRPTSGTESSSVPSLSPDDLSTLSSSYHSAHQFRPPALPSHNSGHSSRTSSSESIQYQHTQTRPELQHLGSVSTSQPLYTNSSEDDAAAPYTPITPISPDPLFPHALAVDVPHFGSSPRHGKDTSFVTDAAEMARRLSCPEDINDSFQSLQPYISSAPLLATSNSMQQQQEDARAGLSMRPSSSGPVHFGASVPSLAAMQSQDAYARRHSVDVSHMGQHGLASRHSNSLLKLQSMQRPAVLYPLQENVQPASGGGHTPSLEVSSAWNSLESVSAAPYSIPPSFPQDPSQQMQTINGASFAYTADSAVEWLPPSTSSALSSRRDSVSLLDTIPETSPRNSVNLGLPMTDDSAFAYPPSWAQNQMADDSSAPLVIGSVEESTSPVITSPGSASSRRNSTAAVRKMRSANTFYQPYPSMHSRDTSYSYE